MTNLIDIRVAKAEIEGRLGRHPRRLAPHSSSLEVVRRTMRRNVRDELHQPTSD